ncbi:MAG: hypothetical protein R3C05_14090 [Pirellulaceae bacterium]
MQGLDDVPWHTLQHAYGTAEDVPRLIRQLQIADPSHAQEESALWQLFGNIYHQGTVYEATSYAVPFLIQLLEDPSTQDPVGILGLLAAIAKGSSYLATHETLLRHYPVATLGIPGTDSFERAKAKEIRWPRWRVPQSHKATNGIRRCLGRTMMSAMRRATYLRVLAASRKKRAVFFWRCQRESRTLYRAGLLLLLCELSHESKDVHRAVLDASSSESLMERARLP